MENKIISNRKDGNAKILSEALEQEKFSIREGHSEGILV